MSLITDAVLYASQQHSGQLRKYHSRPYIEHPLNVLSILVSFYINDPAVLASAVLHDVVEDTDATLDDIRVLFGDEVAFYVHLLTDTEVGNRAERKRQQRERLGGSQDRYAQTIKCADLIDNAQDIRAFDHKFWETFQQEGLALLDVMTYAYAPVRDRAYATLTS